MLMRNPSYFYPRPPRGGRRWALSMTPTSSRYFYPRPPRGGRPPDDVIMLTDPKFLSTPSARRATFPPVLLRGIYRDFYPRPPRGGRRALDDFTFGKRSISIHALREEGDGCRLEEDPPHQDFYPRPPRGERPMVDVNNDLLVEISIHALREEGDPGCHDHCERYAEFLSTPSARRATRRCTESGCLNQISIHALREEGDTRAAHPAPGCHHFYPRPPRGGRPMRALSGSSYF